MPACPTCGKDLTFIPQFDRWYCYAEAKYAPKDFDKEPDAAPAIQLGASTEESHEGHYHCPSCGKELTFIAQYGRYYCYPEAKYAPKDIQPVSGTPMEGAPGAEPTAAEPATMAVIPEPGPTALAVASEPQKPAEAEPPKAEPASEPIPAATAPEPASVTETEAPAAEPAQARPELKRAAVTKAKKAKLLAWCAVYGLDTAGSRTVLRDRLLQYMDEHHIDETEAEAAEEAEEAPAETPAAAPEIPALAPEIPAAAESAVPEPTPAPEAKAKPEEVAPPVEPAPEPTPTPPPVTLAPAETPSPAFVAMEPPKAAPAPAPAPKPPPAPVVEVAKARPCPTCGKDLTYIAQYNRLYCYAEGKYAPKDYGKAAAPTPAAVVVVEAPKPAPPPVPARTPAPPVVEAPRPEPKAANPCPTCGRELRFIKEYDRWYCDAEGKYAPKEYGRKAKNACPTCGKELTWIPEYGRWYCYAEFKYAPKTFPPPTAAERPSPLPAAPPQVTTARPAAEAIVSGLTRAEHLHGKPSAGIGLAAAGFSLFIVQNLVTGLLPALGVVLYDPLTPDGLAITKVLVALGFLGLVLAMAGVVVGLRSVRSR